jgi:hypothetical protein
MALSGVEIVNPRLTGLKPLLHRWTRLIVEYAEAFGEPPYWCNERADVSILAGAAWREGGMCLEEFSAEKGTKSDKWKGRADLFIRLGQTDYSIEAKRLYVGLRPNPAVKRVAESLEAACRDAAACEGEQADFRIGITFAVPYLKADRLVTPRLRDAFLDSIRGVRHDFLAWQFLRTDPKTQVWHDDYRHPGVILLGRL